MLSKCFLLLWDPGQSLSLWEAVQGSGDGGPGSQTAWQVTLASATNQMLDLNGHVISQSPNLLLSGCL